MTGLVTMMAALCAAPLAAMSADGEKAVEPGATAGAGIEAAAPAGPKEAAQAETAGGAPAEPGEPGEPDRAGAETAAPSPPADRGPEGTYMQEVGKKLKRAATNLARAGTELYVQPMEAKRVSGKSISMLWPGVGEALGMGLTRFTGGIIEGATCAVPFPNGWRPLLDE